MTSQGGQRFRRRALRRGYKVVEVDKFLDRVEATLNGEAQGSPVTAQEVHDVMFGVRFGGYDEWQVDLHLDRVERQLAELEERGGLYQRVEQRLAPQPMPPREMPPAPPAPGFDRPAGPPQGFEQQQPGGFPPPAAQPPVREDFPTQGFPSVPQPGQAGPPVPPPVPAAPPVPPPSRPEYSRPDVTSYNSGGYDAQGRHGRADMTGEIRAVDGAYTPDEVAKVDALRRTFQPRRFGSGYDPAQVDRLFDGVMAFMTGRSSVPVADGELDPAQFSLVQGGYFEADVDGALKEVRDLLARGRR
ncbi:DivIVA domain-containing protein [Longispora albida]|uniref:DivIVA domain-containing protein n=1 Tax=Longispora albida TaxID=203523 RepID=UPI00037B46C1|nr:DivIVA domain-containing protein [Longispora albida]